jgi:SAM-dependent methyltransferase
MEAKTHYDNLLGNVYAWMNGDFTENKNDFLNFLREQKISPDKTKAALDLGAGHGAQTAALVELGFNTIAVDFNSQLLEALRENNQTENLTIIEGSIENVADFASYQPQLILCWGDTLAHLESFDAIAKFIKDCYSALIQDGKLILSFRDYSHKLTGNERFIPVKSDERRIMTCFLEYTPEKVIVTDIVHEKATEGWLQKISSYQKVRLTKGWVLEFLENTGFQVTFSDMNRGFVKIIAVKQ